VRLLFGCEVEIHPTGFLREGPGRQ
jgi:hypothetical protein